MSKLYLMPSGKIAVQSAKPVLLTDQEFFDCCCWTCGSTATVQVCCAAGNYSALIGRHTLNLDTSISPYDYSLNPHIGWPYDERYLVLMKDATLGWIVVLYIHIINFVAFKRGYLDQYDFPFDSAHIVFRAASGYTGECPPTGLYSRLSCAAADFPASNVTLCDCSINTDISVYVNVAAQTCSCTAPDLAISSAAITASSIDQGDAYNYTFTLNNPNGVERYFEIDWGDGTSSSGTATGCDNFITVSNTYGYEGVWTITARVYTSSGGTLIDTETATVTVDRAFSFDTCDEWWPANAGGVAGADDNWTLPDVSVFPVGYDVDFRFDAYSIPDRFIVTYNGVEVYNSGWRGSSSYNTVEPYASDGGVTSPGSGEVIGIFTRVTGVNTFSVHVDGGQSGTAWKYDVRAQCP